MIETLVAHPSDQQIHDSQYTTRASYLRVFRLQEKTAKIQTAREKTEAELKANGWTDRKQDRYNPPSDPLTEGAFKMTKSRTYAASVAEAEETARTAYHDFVKAGKFSTIEGRTAAAKVLTTLGYSVETLQAGADYIKSPECEARFGR